MNIKCAACGHERVEEPMSNPPIYEGEKFITIEGTFFAKDNDPYYEQAYRVDLAACPKCLTVKMVMR